MFARVESELAQSLDGEGRSARSDSSAGVGSEVSGTRRVRWEPIERFVGSCPCKESFFW